MEEPKIHDIYWIDDHYLRTDSLRHLKEQPLTYGALYLCTEQEIDELLK